MTNVKVNQKLVSFSDSLNDIQTIKEEIATGWNLVSLIKNGSYFVGILEAINEDLKDSIYIPARKKIKISSS